MKKGVKLSAATVLAISALTPAAVFAAEEQSVADGFYVDGEFLPLSEFQQLSKKDKKQFLINNIANNAIVLVQNGKVFDLTNAEIQNAPAESVVDLGVDVSDYEQETGNKLDPSKGLVSDDVEAELKVESVSAINKTTIELKFNKEVDAVKASNFTIEGAKVNGATLADDNKTVTLSVSGLAYDQEYTILISDVKVNDEVVNVANATFKTPSVTDLWTLEVSPKSTEVIANGADNTVIEFRLLDKDGNVDVYADNMVLAISSTFGNLANTRVTIQDGVGQVVLSSEYSTSAVTSKITAQIIEASEDYKPLIGKVAGEATVEFVPSGAAVDPNAVTFLDAESNQADRIILYFDKEIDVATFVKINNITGDFLTEKRADGVERQVFKDNVKIVVEQLGDEKEILGFKQVEGNKKAIELILAKTKENNINERNTLVDNQKVTVKAAIGTTNNEKTFTLTDAREPEFTGVSVESLKTLNLKFSESVANGKIVIDGLLLEGEDFDVVYGEFDAAKAIDYRDTAVVTLGVYKAGRPGTDDKNEGKQRYFVAGSHSVTVNQLKDFAGLTDNANVSSSQTLTFNVSADEKAPTAKVSVESPEQFRITFDKEIEENGKIIEDAINNGGFKIYNTKTGKYEDVQKGDIFKEVPTFVVTQPDEDKSEFVVELTKDWTNLLNDEKDTYANYKFQIEFDEDLFTNASNGVKSAKIELDLNYANSPLNTVDNVSPVIANIKETKDPNQYEVIMSEPVKLPGLDNAGDTIAVKQGNLPTVLVEFQGKDKDGKIVVVPGKVVDYSSKNGDDTSFIVTTDEKTLKDLVREGYSNNWTVVVKSISDDVGNTAATVTKDFKVEVETVDTLFYILSDENIINGVPVPNQVFVYDNDVQPDQIVITFSKAIVHTGGPNDVTNAANWTLNGKALENVASITVADGNGDPKDGNETVIITFNSADVIKSAHNVISVNKNILSKDGSPLYGEYEVVAETIIGADSEAIENAQKAVEEAEVALDAAQKDFNEALITFNEAQEALDAAVAALEANEDPEAADALQAAVDAAQADFDAAQEALDAAQVALEKAQQDLEDAKAALEALLP